MDKKARVASIAALMLGMVLLAALALATHTQCSDGHDNDNDGQVDLSDPGCSSSADTLETSSSLICDNGLDSSNDADTLKDFRLSGGDPGCISLTDSNEQDGPCDDRIDNDGDSARDYPTDPGCTSYGDPSELNPAVQCDDGVDNDGDGKSDFGYSNTKDSKCSSRTDNDESPRDNCADTDGGFSIFIPGTVSGDDESVPYSFADVCIDASLLREYYCGSRWDDYRPLNYTQNCTTTNNQTNATSGSCMNGACV